MKEDDLLKEALERFDIAVTAEQENRDNAVEDLLFLEGGEENQWSESVRKARKNRPCLTVNRLPTYVKQITGQSRQNRPHITVRAVGMSPPDAVIEKGGRPVKLPMHEVIGGLVRSIEYRSNADSAYDTALEAAVQSGRGAFRVVSEYAGDDTFEQTLRIRRIPNQMTVYVDPLHMEQDASDMRWCFVTEKMPRSEFELEYPDAGLDSFDSGTGDDDVTEGWYSSDDIRVAEYWKKVYTEKVIYQMNDGSIIGAGDLKLAKSMGLRRIRSRTVKVAEVRWWKLCSAHILDGGADGNLWHGSLIPICIVNGDELNVGGRRVLKSAIRDAKDPQRMLNYWTSAIAENIALAPKAGYLVTPKMVEGYEDQWNSLSEIPRQYILYTPDLDAPGGRPVREQGPMLEPALVTERAQCIDDLKATTGIFDASLGARGNEQSGKAIIARRQQGDNTTYVFIDNLAKAVRYCGQVIVDALPHVLDSERLETLRTPSGDEQPIRLNWTVLDPATGEPVVVNDLTKGKWEVAVTVGPAYATQRIEAADSMLQFVQAMPQAGQFVADLLASAMDWPQADVIAERLKRAVPPQILGPQEEQPDQRQGPQGQGPQGQPPDAAQAQQMQQQMLQQQAAAQAQAQQQQIQEMQAKMQMAQEQAKLDQERAQAEQEKVKLQSMILDLQVKQAQLQSMMASQPAPPMAPPGVPPSPPP